MPKMDGYEIATRIRQSSDNRNVPIIFMTSSADDRQTQKGYEVGAVDYLIRPIDSYILTSKVKIFIELYLQRRKSQDLVVKLEHEIIERKSAESEQLNLEAQLRHAQKMETIGTLAGGIAHDFNNLLGSIIGYSDLTLKQIDRNTPIYSYQSKLRDGANRAANLVKQILTFSRQSEHRPRPIKLNTVVKLAMLSRMRIIRKIIKLAYQFGQDILQALKGLKK